MKIGLLTNDFPPKIGGIQTYLSNIYERLADRGHDISVIAPTSEDSQAHDIASKLRIIRRKRLIFDTPALRKQVKQEFADRDIVVVGATLPMAKAAFGPGVPVVIHTHGFEIGWSKLPVVKRHLRKAFGDAALVTTITEWTGEKLGPLIADTPTMRLKTGVDLEAFTPNADPTPLLVRHGLLGRPVVGFVSRLVKRKGVDTLLRAMHEVVEKIPNAALLIIGDGPDRARLERLAAELALSLDQAIFAGKVPHEELPAAFAASDIFVMPCRSRWGGFEVEGLGLVYLEAQACGRPAITGDSGGAPEAIQEGVTGFTVSGTNHEALAEKLIGLLSDPLGCDKMGVAAREFVEKEYDWEMIVDDYEARLKDL